MTEYTPQAYAAQSDCPDWPPWVPQDWVLDRAEELAPEYARMSEVEVAAEAERLSLEMTSPASAWLADPDVRLRDGERERACEALARTIALGSTCLEGITVFDIRAKWGALE